MTPHEIEFLIWCYAAADEHPRINAPVFKETIPKFERLGLITKDSVGENLYTTTEKGAAHIKQLCSLELPVYKAVWVDKHGEIIDVK